MKYATRLNSFASRPEKFWGKANYKPSALELMFERMVFSFFILVSFRYSSAPKAAA